MQNKKFIAAVSLLALLSLTACDVVKSTPADYNDPIVTFNGSTEASAAVYHNIMSIVEDAYHDGALAGDVLNDVLYQYAVSIFGRYNKNARGEAKVGEITLKAAVASLDGDKQAANTFIQGHKAFWTVNKDGKRVDDQGNEVAETATPSQSEYDRLQNKWDYIEGLIAEKMYNKVSSGYSDRSVFEEKVYVTSLANSSKHVSLDGTYYTGLILPSVEPSEVFTKGILTRSHYQSGYALDTDESVDVKAKYIEEEIIPEIYNELLTEQYLVDKKYSVLGSSYARKVNIFSITAKTDFPKQDNYFMDSLINKINALPSDSDSSRVTTTLDDFKKYSNAWLGVSDFDVLDAINARDNSIFKKVTYGPSGDEKTYYEGTEEGEMIKKYLTLENLNDPELYRTVDQSVVSDFTNNGAYTVEVGKTIKENEIKLKDNTTTGWYISNGGLTELPDAIRTRLFSFSVGTALKEDPSTQEAEDRVQKNNEGEWEYVVPEKESTYLARINGAYYLKTSSASQGADPKNDILFYDTSSQTYYVIQVLEAVRSAKLSKEHDASLGGETYPSRKKEEVISEVSKSVAATDSYNSLAKVYWLEQMSIQYHDTTVYNYFSSNYPELFK